MKYYHGTDRSFKNFDISFALEYKDFGTVSEERVDYPVIAKEVSKYVQNKEADFQL